MNLGSDWSTFFFNPLLAEACPGERAPPDPTEPRRSQAQRATAMRPTTHIKAQSKAAKMTTKSDSKVTASGGGASTTVDELVAALRNLQVLVMTQTYIYLLLRMFSERERENSEVLRWVLELESFKDYIREERVLG